jgi:outer membrane lipoprotein carrier protein
MKIVLLIPFLTLLTFAVEVKIPISFKANFTQKITNPKKKIIKYSGSILLDDSGAFKWIYKTPTKKEVCSNGKDFLVVDHDLEQVSFYRLNKSLNLLEVLKNAKHHKDNLFVASYQKKNYTFSIDKKGQIDQIAYRDDLENIVNIHFIKMHYSDKSISKKRLECQYPNSYDMIQG